MTEQGGGGEEEEQRAKRRKRVCAKSFPREIPGSKNMHIRSPHHSNLTPYFFIRGPLCTAEQKCLYSSVCIESA